MGKLYKVWLIVEESDGDSYQDVECLSYSGVWHESLADALEELLQAAQDPPGHVLDEVRRRIQREREERKND